MKLHNLIKAISFLLILSVYGCANAKKMNLVSIGMNKNEVIQNIGTPDSTSAQGGVEYLVYHLYATGDDAWYGRSTKYFVRLIKGKVESYGTFGDFDSAKESVVKIESNEKITHNLNINKKN